MLTKTVLKPTTCTFTYQRPPCVSVPISGHLQEALVVVLMRQTTDKSNEHILEHEI